MDYNDEFQKIDTEAKAYFFGLMYADGCISNKVKNYQKCIRISMTDSQIIDDLHIHFPFMNKEKFDFGKYNKNSKIQFALRKTSVKMFDDLVNNGLFERKSYENKIFLKIPKINESLIPHFIRGFFDGDGSIHSATKRPNGRRIEFCSVSKEFLLEIDTFLKKNNINFYDIREKKGNFQILYSMEACKTETILKFYELLYKDATIYLKRKWEKFQNFRLIRRNENNPLCPKCSSIEVHAGGTRKMKNGVSFRYKCIDCNKRFSIPKAHVKSDELLENQEIDNQQPS